jgi:hypothetical protein
MGSLEIKASAGGVTEAGVGAGAAVRTGSEGAADCADGGLAQAAKRTNAGATSLFIGFISVMARA